MWLFLEKKQKKTGGEMQKRTITTNTTTIETKITAFINSCPRGNSSE